MTIWYVLSLWGIVCLLWTAYFTYSVIGKAAAGQDARQYLHTAILLLCLVFYGIFVGANFTIVERAGSPEAAHAITLQK